MVGIVVVSHSRRLAEAAVELAMQMVRGAAPAIEVAAGLDDHVMGTDAARVKEAIDRVASSDGVLVIMDLGSAVLSAELALELRGDGPDCPVVLSDAPLVEGLVAAVTLSAAGASLDEVASDATRAGTIKAALLGVQPEVGETQANRPVNAIQLAIHNEHGVHARPAARLVETVRRFDADVAVRNLTTEGPWVSGRSVSALSTLGALRGHQLEVTASGRQSREAIAALAALIRRNFDEAVTTAAPTPRQKAPASPGIGIGPKATLRALTPFPVEVEEGDQRERLVNAMEATRAELTATRERVARAAGDAEAQIFDAHALLLDDLSGPALEGLAGTAGAVQAWQAAVDSLEARFASLADDYQRARAEDVRSVGSEVLAHLLGITAHSNLSGVVVAAELAPSQAALLDPDRVVAIVTAGGSPVSHGAILARSLGIPAVVGVGEGILGVPDGTTILVDGTAGTVVVDPDSDTVARYRTLAVEQKVRAEDLLARAGRPAITADGHQIEVVANIASVDDAREAVRQGADGVGLLRTEFLFLDRRKPPSEQEQFEVYTEIAAALGGRRLTVRTLDAGGDKPLPYLGSDTEDNPFLGCRGLRLSLSNPEVFEPQLRAILRVAQQHPISVLFPMVTTVDELRSAHSILTDAAAKIGCAPGTLPMGFEVGAMAEVPAFALRASAAAPLVDFISIGTNDLTQYTLAAERGNASVSSLADPLDPAVLRLVAEVTSACSRVAVCGEMAGSIAGAALLIGLGARELSMVPRAIPEVKHLIRSLSIQKAKHLAELALRRDSAASVLALVSDLTG